MPLIEQMNKSNVSYKYKLDDDIKAHSQIGIYFPRYLVEVISEKVSFSSKYDIREYRYEINGKYLEFELDILEYEEVWYAFYILKDGQRIYSQWYSKNKRIIYDLEEKGKYNIRYFIKDNDNNIVYSDTERLVYK